MFATIKIRDANDKFLCTVGSNKLYLHVSQMKELGNIIVCKRPAVLAIRGCDFCDQFVE